MSRAARRFLVVLVALLSLSLPLAAQARPGRSDNGAESFLTAMSALWHRLAVSVGALWAADTTDGDTTQTPPPPAPDDSTDGRSTIDPLG
jgi:hypothetical protein